MSQAQFAIDDATSSVYSHVLPEYVASTDEWNTPVPVNTRIVMPMDVFGHCSEQFSAYSHSIYSSNKDCSTTTDTAVNQQMDDTGTDTEAAISHTPVGNAHHQDYINNVGNYDHQQQRHTTTVAADRFDYQYSSPPHFPYYYDQYSPVKSSCAFSKNHYSIDDLPLPHDSQALTAMVHMANEFLKVPNNAVQLSANGERQLMKIEQTAVNDTRATTDGYYQSKNITTNTKRSSANIGNGSEFGDVKSEIANASPLPQVHKQGSDEILKCVNCETLFGDKDDLAKHQALHMKFGVENPFICDVCEEGFTVELSLVQHLNSSLHKLKAGKQRKHLYKCTISHKCRWTFRVRSDFVEHLIAAHRELLKQRELHRIKRRRQRLKERNQHQLLRLIDHGQQLRDQVNILNLWEQKLRQTSEQPVHDGLSNGQEDALKQSNPGTFLHQSLKCTFSPFCETVFGLEDDLNKHMELHFRLGKSKPYLCDICERGYQRECDLRCHWNVKLHRDLAEYRRFQREPMGFFDCSFTYKCRLRFSTREELVIHTAHHIRQQNGSQNKLCRDSFWYSAHPKQSDYLGRTEIPIAELNNKQDYDGNEESDDDCLIDKVVVNNFGPNTALFFNAVDNYSSMN